MAALCLPCTAAVASSAASDSRRINTVYSLPTVYNKVYSIPSTGTYTVPYQFVVSSARIVPCTGTVPYTRYTRRMIPPRVVHFSAFIYCCFTETTMFTELLSSQMSGFYHLTKSHLPVFEMYFLEAFIVYYNVYHDCFSVLIEWYACLYDQSYHHQISLFYSFWFLR